MAVVATPGRTGEDRLGGVHAASPHTCQHAWKFSNRSLSERWSDL